MLNYSKHLSLGVFPPVDWTHNFIFSSYMGPTLGIMIWVLWLQIRIKYVFRFRINYLDTVMYVSTPNFLSPKFLVSRFQSIFDKPDFILDPSIFSDFQLSIDANGIFFTILIFIPPYFFSYNSIHFGFHF